MNVLLKPASLAMAALVVAFALLKSLPLIVLSLVLWIAVVAIQSIAESGRRSGVPDLSEMSAESRILIRPLRELREQIERLVQMNADMPSVRVVGREALAEADKIVEHSLKLGELRTELKKTLRGKSEAEVGLENLRRKLEIAATDEERDALASAVKAHEEEIAHYATIEASIAQVDSRLRSTEAALSELKTRIAVGAAGARAEALHEHEMSDVVTRLKSLSKSFGEAETMLQGHLR